MNMGIVGKIAAGAPVFLGGDSAALAIRLAARVAAGLADGEATAKALRAHADGWRMRAGKGLESIVRAKAARGDAKAAAKNGSIVKPCGWVAAMRMGPLMVLPVSGPLDRNTADCCDSNGNQYASSYQDMMDAIAAAKADPTCGGVLCLIDSPGGAAIGCGMVADVLAGCGKPVMGYAMGMAASAAYFIAMGCGDGLYCSSDALMGCIGTVMPVIDQSKALAMDGLSVELLASDAPKTYGWGLGPMSDAERASLQSEVDTLANQFKAAVAAGRNVPAATVQGWASSGRGMFGAEAVAAGLADGVCTLEKAVQLAMLAALGGGGGEQKAVNHNAGGGAAAARSRLPQPRGGRSRCMTIQDLMALDGGPAVAELLRGEGRSEAGKPKAATLKELRAAFPDSSDFVLGQLEIGASLADAKAAMGEIAAARAEKLTAELAAKQAELDKANAEIATLRDVRAKAGSGGVAPVKAGPSGEGGGGDAKGTAEAFEARVAAMTADGKTRQSVAVAKAKAEDPAGWQAWRKSVAAAG